MGAAGSYLGLGRFGMKKVKVIILGAGGSGKTTMINRIKADSEAVTIPTRGMELEDFSFKDQGNLPLFDDIGSRTSIRPIYRDFTTEADAVIIVVDSSDMDSTGLGLYINIHDIHQLESFDVPSGAPVVVVANKQDLPDAVPPETVRRKLEEARLDKTRDVPEVFGTVATTGKGVFDMLDYIALKISEKEGSTKTWMASGKLKMAALKVKSFLQALRT